MAEVCFRSDGVLETGFSMFRLGLEKSLIYITGSWFYLSSSMASNKADNQSWGSIRIRSFPDISAKMFLYQFMQNLSIAYRQ